MTALHQVRGAALRPDECEAPPGLTEYEARNAVRNLIHELGDEQAHERLEAFWREERSRKQ